MKGIFVILDGVADEPSSQLKDVTPLEYAKTPNLDFFSSIGEVDHCFPIAPGVAPQSSSGIVSLLGADFRDASRGLLEAMGAGVTLREGDLAMRCNFSTIDNLESLKLIDRRAGRTLTTKEAYGLAKEVNSKVSLPFKFELIPTVGHRAVLVFRGALSDKISNIDPSYEDGLSVEGESNQVVLSKPYEGSKKAILSADLLNTFVSKSYVILDNHPINLERKKKGFFAANFILCRDAGIAPIKISKNLKGSWIGLGYMPLEMGVIRAFGMRPFSFNIHAMESIDFYDHAEQVLSKAIKSAIEMIQKNMRSVDYFYVHFKETDIPGHDNKPKQKVKFIEMIDKEFFGTLRKIIPNNDFKMVVTADHTTSCRAKSHTSHPVPLLFYKGNGKDAQNRRFTEKEGMKGKPLMGRQLLEKTLYRQ